jgi:DNA topoisomerase-1
MQGNSLKQITQEDFTAKDFRVWAGSVSALFAFQEIGPFETQTECKRKIVEVLDLVASKLGNTRTVCKKYYVHPTVIATYENGTINNYKVEQNIKNNHLNPEEEALVRLLETEKIAEVLG